MDVAFTHASVILPDGILEQSAVLVRNGVISWVGPTSELPENPAETVDLGGFYLSPGFIDLHVHGGGGNDATDVDLDGLKTICRTHEASGTTSLCLALVPTPRHQTARALQNIQQLAIHGTGGARLLGSYLEGPFVNPSRVNAYQERWTLEPDLDVLKELTIAAGGWLRIVVFAPELPGTEPMIRWLAGKMGLIAAIGHTSATCEQTESAIRSGCKLATHLFNAMKPFHHRDPNATGAVLASDVISAEVIMDGIHLHPTAAKIAFKSLGPDHFILITDATAVVGSTDGRGKIGGTPITYVDGAARFSNGQMAGGALTMIDAVRRMIDTLDVPYHTAVRCATLVPARVMGIEDRLGSIEVGKHADLLILDKSDLRVLYSYIGGNRIFRSPY